MNIQRFIAPTSREAMSKARAAFGDSAVIVSSRSTSDGFEVVATTEENLANLPLAGQSPKVQPAASAVITANQTPKAAAKTTTVQADTEAMAMSTLNFQDYVRERMLKRRKEVLDAKNNENSKKGDSDFLQRTQAQRLPAQSLASLLGADLDQPDVQIKPWTPPVISKPQAKAALAALSLMHANASAQAQPQASAPLVAKQPAPAAASAPIAAAAIHMPAPIVTLEQQHMGLGASSSVSSEINALKSMIEDRFNTLAWLGSSRSNPQQSGLMLKLISAGFSPALVRTVLEKLPADQSQDAAMQWIGTVFSRNLKTADAHQTIADEGGIVALIGATGVGKTTTAAKLAAQCVQKYGANSVGLITLDTYRIAGYEQLRAYGRMMGVVAHLAHDAAALKDLLNLLAGKRLVIIDTAGLGQRDPRIQDMMDTLNIPNLKKLLVLNASSHGDTLDDVLSTFKAKSLHGVLLSKVDEAVKLAPAIDALIRHQVVLRGVANGQRVPEDWLQADATQLVAMALGSAHKSAFDPSPADLGFFFSQPATAHMTGGLHV